MLVGILQDLLVDEAAHIGLNVADQLAIAIDIVALHLACATAVGDVVDHEEERVVPRRRVVVDGKVLGACWQLNLDLLPCATGDAIGLAQLDERLALVVCGGVEHTEVLLMNGLTIIVVLHPERDFLLVAGECGAVEPVVLRYVIAFPVHTVESGQVLVAVVGLEVGHLLELCLREPAVGWVEEHEAVVGTLVRELILLEDATRRAGIDSLRGEVAKVVLDP